MLRNSPIRPPHHSWWHALARSVPWVDVVVFATFVGWLGYFVWSVTKPPVEPTTTKPSMGYEEIDGAILDYGQLDGSPSR